MSPRPSGLLRSITLAAVIAACQGPTGSPAATAPGGTPKPAATLGPGALDLSKVSVTLEAFTTVPGPALAMAAPDDGTGRLFVATQDGFVWVVEADGTVHERPAIDLRPRLTSGGERGLLGIALDSDFATNQRMVVDFTNKDGDTIVAALWFRAGDPDVIDEDSFTNLLFVDQPYSNHNGGAVAFGPDGDLYVSLGDGGSGGDPQDHGQRLDTLLGKILRVDIGAATAGAAYGIPKDNPYASGGGEPEIWLSGLRNPWRMSFDRETGDLWIGDVGQGAWEEVDVAPAGTGGLNFGWRRMEGTHCFDSDSCDRNGLTLPVSEYGRDQGCTVIGGPVYRGQDFEFLQGTYLFADYCTGHLFAIDASVRTLTAPTVVGSGSNGIAAWGEDVDGELYVLALDGTVSRVSATLR